MAVKSPCIDICIFDPVSGWCEGCGRTRKEVAGWGKLSPYHRGAVERDLPKRLAKLASKSQIAKMKEAGR